MARSLNFTRAAEECNVTQPSLTRAIQKLEEEFDGPLFRRERSRTHLTDLGRQMLPHLERSYEAAQAAKVLAREIGEAQVTPLTLGVAHTIENDVLDAVIAETGAGLPGFELTLQSGTSKQLINLGLSLALAYLCGVSECIFHSVPDMAGNFYTVSARPGHERNLIVPDFATHRRDRVAEGEDRFWIPCGGSRLEFS